jgi:hypothetical protein
LYLTQAQLSDFLHKASVFLLSPVLPPPLDLRKYIIPRFVDLGEGILLGLGLLLSGIDLKKHIE